MRRALSLGSLLATFACSSLAGADERSSSLEAGARLGFGFPVGAIEAGERASDLTHGAIPLALDAGAVLNRVVTIGGMFQHAPTIPKLCGSASECIASLGGDTSLVVLARFHVGRLAFVRPVCETGVGWQWSQRTLVDNDVESVVRFRGPIAHLALIPTVALSRRVDLGFVIGTRLALASRVGLDAPGVATRRSPDRPDLYGTFDLGLRLGITL